MPAEEDARFVENSVLEILIPQASDRDIDDILQTVDDTTASDLVSSIPQREVLFYDESLPVYAVLRTTHSDEDSLRDCLSRMNIGLEAHVVSSPNINDAARDKVAPGSQTRDVVWTGKVNVTEDPITIVVESAEETKTVLLTWKTMVTLSRPRIRLQSPVVLFKISASLQPTSMQTKEEIDPYLPSGVPLPTNILRPLGTDAALNGVLPRYAAVQAKRLPSSISVQDTLPVRVAARRACRAVPVLSSRIRIQKAPFNPGVPSMIGTLEIDVPPFAQYPLVITDIKVNLPQGHVEEVSFGSAPRLPMTLRARDQVVALYSLRQNAQASVQGQGMQTLDVMISVSVSVSEECHPHIQVGFKANVDFSGSNHARQNLSSQKNSKLSESGPSTVKPGDQFIDSSMSDNLSTVQEKLGIVIKFTAKGTVYVGEPFRWEIFVINKSGKQRRLGLSMLHKRRTGGEKRISSRPTSLTDNRQSKSDIVAEAVTDDNLLYTMMKSHNRDATHLLCLNTDVKIGPLNPGSCFSTDMEFLPLTQGFLHIEAIRLTDYSTNEAVDLRELPDIIAIERR